MSRPRVNYEMSGIPPRVNTYTGIIEVECYRNGGKDRITLQLHVPNVKRLSGAAKDIVTHKLAVAKQDAAFFGVQS